MGGFRDIFRQLWHWWDSPSSGPAPTPDVIITFVGALAEDIEFTGALSSVVAWHGALADDITFTGSISD
jgi:hypothetical protein